MFKKTIYDYKTKMKKKKLHSSCINFDLTINFEKKIYLSEKKKQLNTNIKIFFEEHKHIIKQELISSFNDG